MSGISVYTAAQDSPKRPAFAKAHGRCPITLIEFGYSSRSARNSSVPLVRWDKIPTKIVASPRVDAIRAFQEGHLDVLVLGNYLIGSGNLLLDEALAGLGVEVSAPDGAAQHNGGAN